MEEIREEGRGRRPVGTLYPGPEALVLWEVRQEAELQTDKECLDSEAVREFDETKRIPQGKLKKSPHVGQGQLYSSSGMLQGGGTSKVCGTCDHAQCHFLLLTPSASPYIIG